MPRMLVLTDSETATGFRLAGVEVREASSDNVLAELESIVASNHYGLVAVDEGLVKDPIRATERMMRGRELPVILPMPSLGAAFDEGDDAVSYMKDLVRSAIGFDIKLE
jgi:V/A-type H+-transporting ATPase subunit F